MKILGIASKSHDSGLAILSEGSPALVLEEERLNREKHTRAFPNLSIREAFGNQGFDIADMDVITIPWDMGKLRRTFFQSVTGNMPKSLNLLRPMAHKTQDTAIVNLPFRLWLGLGKRLGFLKLPKIVQVAHHDAHAAVFCVSPYDDAVVLVMDGYGDESATSAYMGCGNRLERLWADDFFDSVGMLYTCVSEHLGFKANEEGTVMALAACGGPRFVEPFKELIELLPEGRIRINRDFVSYDTHGFIKPFKQKFHDRFGPPREHCEPIGEAHRDLAHALQARTEDAILHVVRGLSQRTQCRNLVLTGGVALNCVANARILEETDFDSVWVPPVASDSGVILGSTLWHWHQTLANPRAWRLTHPYCGLEFGETAIIKALDDFGLCFERYDEGPLLKKVAQDLADQRIVGWFQGPAEIGPRALGNRSILSDARCVEMKHKINARIKHREAFRPFAPVVLIEHLSEYFEFTEPDPFMTMAPRIRPEKRDQIPAAAHVDGTGRIQTIDRATNPRYYGVIEEYAKITGIPVILNTSFNRQEPIVNRPEEAISCFLRTEMDVLVLGDFYSTDRNREAIRRAHAEFKRQK